jgi:predicted ester cyclase
MKTLEGTSGPFRDLTDYILGITHEIWESRHVERIDDYYSSDCLIYTLSGMVHGAKAIIANTHDTLRVFPDRLLLGEAVIGARLGPGRFLSSHRIGSPMTQAGDLPYMPATGRKVFVRTIADCLVEDGRITKEWLVRDNYSLASQIGADPLAVARFVAQGRSAECLAWLESEQQRARAAASGASARDFAAQDAVEFAKAVIGAQWGANDPHSMAVQYAPYAVLHDSHPIASGREVIESHYVALRAAMSRTAVSIDHVAVQDRNDDEYWVAARWTSAFEHTGTLWGASASGRPALILGVTHWQIVAGRIVAEWSIYDRIAVLAQIV